MSLIRFENVSKYYDDLPVLREVYFHLDEGDRVGLIGKNGTGKTTLLKLILGQEAPTEGEVALDQGLQIGYFSQFSTLDGGRSIWQTLDDLFADLHAIEEELLEVEIALEEGPDKVEMDRLLHRQAALIETMNRRGGWTYQNEIDTALTRLGFNEVYRTCPVDQLSGGWRNRAALSKILLQAPDVLLMDEPTNFLDIEGLDWLEEYFAKHRGALIVVSHDRHFLDRVVNRVVEVENYHLQEYSGGFADYVREKPFRLKTLERQFQHEEELLTYEAEAIADRREAAKNPSQALKRKLAGIKKEVQPRPVDRIVTDIYEGLQVSNKLCRVEAIAKSYGDQVLFRDLYFEVQRGDRIAIIGPNGCGKTTLLRALTQSEEPLGAERAFDAGRVAWAKSADLIYYNEVFENLDLNDTVTHAVNVVGLAYAAPRKKVNRFLELMRFSELDLQQRIGTLSGGQRARVALAQCLLSGASVIVLDEPTNHLDLTSTQVMERALIHFPGAVVVVSHDRFFIDKVATRLLIFEGQGRVREVAGNWTLWQASLDKKLDID
ncbi:MAG: ABC-F family ATP-binding cassette domain-containing protein [Anaerolineae bacterium]|nr:ABC-F family ATP-binding cassette domain-containing protein [Anaerolineae bacterium]